MFEDIETHKKLSKWIIGTFTACILIYLGIRHISHVADAVMWLKDLLNPLLIGLKDICSPNIRHLGKRKCAARLRSCFHLFW